VLSISYMGVELHLGIAGEIRVTYTRILYMGVELHLRIVGDIRMTKKWYVEDVTYMSKRCDIQGGEES